METNSGFDEFTIFIDSRGIDSEECGAQLNPCGTMAFATALSMYSNKYQNVNITDLYITGQNEMEISLWHNDSKTSADISFLDELKEQPYYFGSTQYSPCTLWYSFTKSIDITFDVNSIHLMKDWFPDICKEYWNQRILFTRKVFDKTTNTFNNLIINDINMNGSIFSVLMQFKDESILYLNNCSFYNLNKTKDLGSNTNAVLDLSVATIYNSSFDTILLSPHKDEAVWTGISAPTFIELEVPNSWSTSDISLNMVDCSIINYKNTNGPFILNNADNMYSDTRSINIYNSVFCDIWTSNALIISSSFLSNWKVEMNIFNTDFLNIKLGSILITQNLHSVYISDCTITTQQRIKDLIDLNEQHSSISLFSFGDDSVTMNNISLHYIYDTFTNCDWTANATFEFVIFNKWSCYAPIQFMQNNGIVNITRFIVSNDIQYDDMSWYPCGGYKQCQFLYHTSETEYALLYNEGELNMYDFLIRGTGIHFQLITNRGNAFISNAISQYSYYSNYYDAFTLNIHVLFRNEGQTIFGGTLQINNSYLYGAEYQAIQLLRGSVYILNTTIKQTKIALTASPQVNYLYIDNVSFINIGAFYISYFSIYSESFIIPPPILISAHNCIIKNSYFSFFNSHGFIASSPKIFDIFLSYSYETSLYSYQTTLIDNIFELNTDSSFTNIAEMEMLRNLFLAHTSLNDPVLSAIYTDLESIGFVSSSLFDMECLLCFDSFTTLHMIGNSFMGNTLSIDTPFVKIDNGANTNCVSNNIIYGFALNIVSGTVTSCFRNKLVHILNETDAKCWNGGLRDALDLNRTQQRDYYIATHSDIDNNVPLIAVHSTQSVFAADKISFLIEESDETVDNGIQYNAINLISGDILMFDVEINKMMDLFYGKYCTVHCLEMVNSTSNDLSISQVNINCMEEDDTNDMLSLLDDAMHSSPLVNHWSAYKLDIISSTDYYPGGKIYLTYAIYDFYGNAINDYNQDIVVQLQSLSLNIQINVTIDGDGDCVICEQGIYIQAITTEYVGNVFTIETMVQNNELIVNDIVFNVSGCASGFGKISGIKQCALCNNGYFSFLPTTDECYSCNTVDGLSCEGGNTVIIGYNNWLSAIRSNNSQFISALKITQKDSIYTSQCPPRQCCQSTRGCSFLKEDSMEVNNEQICAANRDVNVPLCGKCVNGMYELYGTSACGACTNWSNLMYLIPIFIGTLLLVLFIIYDAKPAHVKDGTSPEIDYKKMVKKDEIQCLSVMVMKILMYYFQSLSQILYAKGIEHVLTPVLTIFDLSFNFNNNSSQSEYGICIFPFINNPLNKIILNSIFVLVALSHFMWIPFVIKQFDINTKISILENTNITDELLNIQNTTKRQWVSVAALKLFVISCSTLLIVAFKLLSCITFPNSHMFHFYNPIEPCFSGYWFLGLLLCLFVILSFIFMFYKIYKQTDSDRYSTHNIFRKMIHSYNGREWFWEFVIFSRRVFIALCLSIRSVNAADVDAILHTVLLLYLSFHVRRMPFKYTRLNVLETICLIVLISILAIFRDDFAEKHSLFTDIYIVLAILLPFVLVFYHLIRILMFIRSSSKTLAFSETELKKIERAKKRAPIKIQNDPDIDKTNYNCTETQTYDADNDESIQIEYNDNAMQIDLEGSLERRKQSSRSRSRESILAGLPTPSKSSDEEERNIETTNNHHGMISNKNTDMSALND